MGAALFMARVGAGAQDISQLIPFLLRVWRYFCGVMYSIAALPADCQCGPRTCSPSTRRPCTSR
jgi:hypothetical protein